MPDIKWKIGDKKVVRRNVQTLRVDKADGTGFVRFYYKQGDYVMQHGGTADVGEFATVSTAFPEYTQELQEERTGLIGMIGDSVDSEINTLEEAYNV